MRLSDIKPSKKNGKGRGINPAPAISQHSFSLRVLALPVPHVRHGAAISL